MKLVAKCIWCKETMFFSLFFVSKWFDADIQSYSLFLELLLLLFFISRNRIFYILKKFENSIQQQQQQRACRFHSDAYVNWEPHNEKRCVLCGAFYVSQSLELYACLIFFSSTVSTKNEERNNKIQLQSIIWFSFHEGEHFYLAAAAAAAAITTTTTTTTADVVYLMCFLFRITYAHLLRWHTEWAFKPHKIYEQSSICYG